MKPAAIFKEGHGAVLECVGLQLQQQRLHGGVDAAVVSGAGKHQMAALERGADLLGYVGVGHVEDSHVPHALFRQTGGQDLAGVFRVAVDGAAENSGCPRLRRVGAPALILFQEPADVLPPDGTVEGAEVLNIQSRRLFQHVLHRRAVFAHDVGVIPAGVVQPLLLEIHLVGEDVAVHSAEGAEGVGAEQGLLRGIIGHHDLRPVDQRGHDKGQLVAAQGQGIPLLHRLEAALHLHGEELLDHGQGLGVADNGGLRVAAQDRSQRGGVVRLHVVDDHIIQRLALQGVFQILKEPLRDGLIHRIQQGRLFILDQIGVVGDATGDGIYIFKQGQPAVRAAQPDQIRCDFLRAIHS